jgi:hypothetical protein
MAHAFDSGLAKPQETLLRDSAVEVIRGLHVDNGGYLRAVEPWGGLARSYQDETGIDLLFSELKGRAPAILVGLGDIVGKPAGMGGFNFAADVELVLYHSNNHLASMTAGRTAISSRALVADTRDPGLEVMRAHTRQLLIGQRLGGQLVTNAVGEATRKVASIKQVEFLREEELRTDKTITVWAQRFGVRMTYTINPHRGVTQMLEELRTVVRPTGVDPGVGFGDQAKPGELVVEIENEPNTP